VTVESARAKARAALVETDRHGEPLALIERGALKPVTLRVYAEPVAQYLDAAFL
jgi:hypothetical protein